MPWVNATVTNASAAPTDRVNSSAVPSNKKYLIVHNPSESAYLTFTLDGTVPVVQTNGITLYPGGTFTSDQYTMNGPMLMISSAASQSATIYWR